MPTDKTSHQKIRAKHGEGPRAGKRLSRARKKTAKALGQNFEVTKPWRQRKQDGDY